MGISLEQIKRDFTRHRKKTAMLGVLALVMCVLIVKAVFDMRPQVAVALPPTTNNPVTEAGGETEAEAVVDPGERIRQSQELWKVLREKRGLDAVNAFRFDASYFPVDPSRRVQAEADHEALPDSTSQKVSNEEIERAARIRDIREQARGLIVRSTVVGNAASKPVAVINDRILGIGDCISGFRITAIQARKVEFEKDGIPVAIPMAEDAPVQ